MDQFNAMPTTERLAWLAAAVTAVGLTVSVAPLGVVLIVVIVVVWRRRFPSSTPTVEQEHQPVIDYPEDITVPPSAPEPTVAEPAPETVADGWGF
jgi:hypothetical protein